MKLIVPALALVAALSFVVAAPAVAAGSQTWYLGGEFDLVANRGSVPPPTSDPEFPSNHVLIPNAQGAVWEANEPAAVNVDFGSGEFAWSLRLATGNFLGTYHVEIGISDCNGNFIPMASSDPVSGPGLTGQQVQSGVVEVSAFIVQPGQCLAMRVANDGDAEEKPVRVMYSVPDSFFSSNPQDPGYPTPELGSVLLVGAGVAVVATVALRRK